MSLITEIKTDNFHYYAGVNCYQHAIGYPHPLVMRRIEDGKLQIAHISLNPLWSPQREEATDALSYKEQVIDGCIADGAIDLGSDLSFKDGYRTVALLFSAVTNDFHFIIVNKDGSGEDKFPCRHVNRATNWQALKSRNRIFNRFLLLPEGKLPDRYAVLNPRPLRLAQSPRSLGGCLEIDEAPNLNCGSLIDIISRTMTLSSSGHNLDTVRVPDHFIPILDLLIEPVEEPPPAPGG